MRFAQMIGRFDRGEFPQSFQLPYLLRAWNIYSTFTIYIFKPHVGKYTSPMDPMGLEIRDLQRPFESHTGWRATKSLVKHPVERNL